LRSTHAAFTRQVVVLASVNRINEDTARNFVRNDVTPDEFEKYILTCQAAWRAWTGRRMASELVHSITGGDGQNPVPFDLNVHEQEWESHDHRHPRYKVAWDEENKKYTVDGQVRSPHKKHNAIASDDAPAKERLVVKNEAAYLNIKRMIHLNYEYYQSALEAMKGPSRLEVAKKISSDEAVRVATAAMDDSLIPRGLTFLWEEDKDDLEKHLAAEARYYAVDHYVALLTWQMITLLYLAIVYPYFDPATFALELNGVVVDGGGLSSDYVDSMYLTWIVLMFLEIIVDRIIYLITSISAKWFLQVGSVLFYHYLLLVYYKMQCQEIHGRSIRHDLIALFYILRCGYWYVSSAQIRVGYPKNCHGEWLLNRCEMDDPKGSGLVIVTPDIPENVMHKIYLWIPFLFEMRSLLDWCFQRTPLDLIEYIKLSDIHSTLFAVAYLRNREKGEKRYVGMLQPDPYRAALGGGVFLLLCIVIWAPLFIFSGNSPFLVSNPSTEVLLMAKINTPWTAFNIWSVTSNSVNTYESAKDSLRDVLSRAAVQRERQVHVHAASESFAL